MRVDTSSVVFLYEEKKSISELIACFAGVFFIGLASQVKVFLPFTPVPITLQTLAIFLVVGLLREFGVISVSLYLILGLLGLPLFAGGAGGISTLLSPTAGYLIGFLVSAYLAYLAYERFSRNFFKLLGAWFLINLVMIHGLGILWLGYFLKIYDLGKLILLGSLPFIFGDLIKVFIAVWVLRIFK